MSISLASFLPGASMLVVTTPQEAARKVAERAGKMAERTNLRPLGVVENMSWFVCPHCGERETIFGTGGGQEAADTLGVPLMGQVPLVPALRAGGDDGRADRAVASPTRPARSRCARPPTPWRSATKTQGRQAADADDVLGRSAQPRRPRPLIPRHPVYLGRVAPVWSRQPDEGGRCWATRSIDAPS